MYLMTNRGSFSSTPEDIERKMIFAPRAANLRICVAAISDASLHTWRDSMY